MSRVRHDSVLEAQPRNSSNHTRFPSAQLNTETFVHLDDWNENNARNHERIGSKTSITASLRTWFRGWSRRRWLYVSIGFLFCLFVLAMLIVSIILFLLPSHSKNNQSTPMPIVNVTHSTPTTSGTSSGYLKGAVVGTVSRALELPFPLETLVPQTVDYIFDDLLLLYGNHSLGVIMNRSLEVWSLPLSNCSLCSVLYINQQCLNDGFCDEQNIISHCEGCGNINNIFNVHGSKFSSPSTIGERRIVQGANDLLVTTTQLNSQDQPELQIEPFLFTITNNRSIFSPYQSISGQHNTIFGQDQSITAQDSSRKSPTGPNVYEQPVDNDMAIQGSCIMQMNRISEGGSVYSGSAQSCLPNIGSFPTIQKISTLTNFPGNASIVSMYAAMDEKFSLRLNFTDRTPVYVHLDINDTVLEMKTTIVNDTWFLIGILQPGKFYAVRYNLHSQCVSVLENFYMVFDYPGDLAGSYWINEKFLTWFKLSEDSKQGVTIVTNTILWPDDSVCPSQQTT